MFFLPMFFPGMFFPNPRFLALPFAALAIVVALPRGNDVPQGREVLAQRIVKVVRCGPALSYGRCSTAVAQISPSHSNNAAAA